MKIIRLFLLIMFFISPLCMAKNQQVNFAPNKVVLEGVIVMLTFPGPPNYESIKQGDKAETGPYLLLNKPVDIQSAPDAKNNLDKAAQNVKVLQLIVLNKDDWKAVKQGNVVRVTGSLSSPITGHHHARALLEVKQISVLSKKKIDSHQLAIPDEDKTHFKSQHLQE